MENRCKNKGLKYDFVAICKKEQGSKEFFSSSKFVYGLVLRIKVAQINYVSRNQLHCTANFNFGLNV